MADLTTLLSKFLNDLYAGTLGSSFTITKILAGDGSAAAPSYAFGSAGNTDNGMFLSASDTVAWSAGGTQRLSLSATALTSTVPVLLGAGSAAAPSVTSSAAATKGMWFPGANVVSLGAASTEVFRIDSSFGIGLDGAWPLSFGATASTPDVSLSRGAANRLDLASGDSFYVVSGGLGVNIVNTAAGTIALTEQTAPSAPAANGVILYAVDNGGGKTQLMALFSSGAAQQLAIQP